jgi:hypothetical protein
VSRHHKLDFEKQDVVSFEWASDSSMRAARLLREGEDTGRTQKWRSRGEGNAAIPAAALAPASLGAPHLYSRCPGPAHHAHVQHYRKAQRFMKFTQRKKSKGLPESEHIVRSHESIYKIGVCALSSLQRRRPAPLHLPQSAGR